jgi:hypothetical protein
VDESPLMAGVCPLYGWSFPPFSSSGLAQQIVPVDSVLSSCIEFFVDFVLGIRDRPMAPGTFVSNQNLISSEND